MTTDSFNPFVLPGFGQSGEFAANPVMASMEMMRQAWQSLAEQGGFGAPSMATTLSAEELERRITDLRAVENWLRMNLTVLSSTIQGLEVQRATLSTFKHFMHNAAATGQDASALTRFFGMTSANAADAKAAQGQAASAQTASAASGQQTTARQPADTAHSAAFDADQAVAATQAWWDMLRKQFDSLAAATAASMPSAAASSTAASADTAAASPSRSPRKTASGKPKARKSSTKSTASGPRNRR